MCLFISSYSERDQFETYDLIVHISAPYSSLYTLIEVEGFTQNM